MLISEKVKDQAKEDPKFWHKLLRKVFYSPDGRVALAWLMERSGMFNLPPTCNLEQAASITYRKQIVIELLHTLEIEPADIVSEPGDTGNPLDRIVDQDLSGIRGE